MLGPVNRRTWLQAAGLGTMLSGIAAWARTASGEPAKGVDSEHLAHRLHLPGTVGRVAPSPVDPMRYLRSWNFNHLPPNARERFYRETPRPDGTVLRDYDIFAVDREIEVAPGVAFAAWTYNGQVPGPTIRATEGEDRKSTRLNSSHLGISYAV